MNVINITGNLGRDADKKEFGENTLFEFSVAVNGASDKKQEDNDKFYASAWFRVKFWTKNPERFEDAFNKGNSVMVSGSLKESKWTDAEGVEKTSYYINANEAHVLQKLGGGGGSSAPKAATASAPEIDPFA